MLKYYKTISYKSLCIVCSTVVLLFSTQNLLSQLDNIGIPGIINYTKEDYKGGTQNWAGFSQKTGYSFFANNSGLICYNNLDWSLYKLPNKSILRSVALSESQKIFVGGQDEVGYFESDSIGQLQYQSIRELIPNKYLPLEDVWEMVCHENKIYFRSVNKIYIYDEDGHFEVIDPQHPIVSLDKVRSEVFYVDLVDGIHNITDINDDLSWSAKLKYKPIVSILSYEKDNYLILTENDGIYLYDGVLKPLDSYINTFLKKSRINTGAILDDNSIALATQFEGVVILDSLFNIKSHFNKSTGLQNNNVLSLHQSYYGELWLGSSNGIDKIELNNSLKSIFPDKDSESAIYDIEVFNERMYFGTNNGLYYYDLNRETDGMGEDVFVKVNYTDGQVWGLDIVEDELFMGHNEGAFKIGERHIEKISEIPGAWKFLSIDAQHMYVGTYDGVDIYRKEKGIWRFFKKLEGFNESARIMVHNSKNELWVSHPYRGVYRITHNDEFEEVSIRRYDDMDGLASSLLNYVFGINNKVLVCSETGVFEYDDNTDQFVNATYISNNFSVNINIKRLFQTEKDIIWYIAEGETGYLTKSENDIYIKTIVPDLANVFVGGFEQMYIYDENIILACTDKGAKKIEIKDDYTNIEPQIQFASISLIAQDKREIYCGYSDDIDDLYSFEYFNNALSIKFVSSDHSHKSLYRYRLLDNQQDWSEWSSSTVKEFNNLGSGIYDFEVQAKNRFGEISKSEHLIFEISPPWYKSKLAYGFYSIFGLLVFLGMVFIPKQKFDKEKKVLTLANEQSEAEIERLKNEKLRSEIDHKNRELASSTLHLVQKNETIAKLRAEMIHIQKKIKDPAAVKELRKVISVLSDDERLEDDWESFSKHFDQVHSDFLKRIKAAYPALSPKDLKMAAYLRMNLSTKEISPLLNISIRGVEISRYRLRKKMELQKEVNLSEFMMQF